MSKKPILPHDKNVQLSLFLRVFPWICLGGGFLLAMAFQLKFGEYFLNSDMAAEMLLAKELNDSHSFLLAENWFYSTELRVLYQHIPFRIGLLLFPNNWLFARVFGQAVMLVLHAASFLFMMSMAGHKRAGVYGAAALMLPFSYWYLFHGVFSGAYLAHMVLISSSTGLILMLTGKSRKKSFPFWMILLAIFSFLQGLSGVRMLMNLYLPLLLASVIVFFLQLNREPFSEKFYCSPHFTVCAITLFATVFCAAGYLVNSKILVNTYAFKSFNEQVWQPFSFQALAETFGKFLALFGYPYEPWQGLISTVGWEEISLFSIPGILGAASVVLMSAVVFSTFRLCRLWNKLSFPQQIIFALYLSCLAVDGAIYAFLEKDLNGSYWLPVIPLAFASVIIWIKNEQLRLKDLYQYGIGAVLLICIACTTVSSSLLFVKYPARTAKGIEKVTQWLVDNGYRSGYATFWYSDIITELSNGEIEMWTCRGTDDLTPYNWLQKRSHSEPPEGPFFILLPEHIYDQAPDSIPFPIYEDTVVYQEGAYTILSYGSIDDVTK